MFDSNADVAHGRFVAHAEHFSPGIRDLLATHAFMEPFGMKLLPFQDASARLEEEIQRHTVSWRGRMPST